MIKTHSGGDESDSDDRRDIDDDDEDDDEKEGDDDDSTTVSTALANVWYLLNKAQLWNVYDHRLGSL